MSGAEAPVPARIISLIYLKNAINLKKKRGSINALACGTVMRWSSTHCTLHTTCTSIDENADGDTKDAKNVREGREWHGKCYSGHLQRNSLPRAASTGLLERSGASGPTTSSG